MNIVFSWLVRLSLLAAIAYGVSPFVAAAWLDRAIKSGDTSYLEAQVDWTSVRISLKSSILARLAEKADARPANAGVFRRIGYSIQDNLTPIMIDRMLQQTVSPSGFVAHAEKERRLTVAAASVSEAASSGPATDGIWKRILRAKFTDPMRFEFDVRDKLDPGKIYRARFDWRSGWWRMTAVELLAMG